jgi:hypothetical protein
MLKKKLLKLIPMLAMLNVLSWQPSAGLLSVVCEIPLYFSGKRLVRQLDYFV